MTVATVTTVHRRLFGLAREVYAIRCRACPWHTEAREYATALSLSHLHQCRNHTERKPA